MKILFALLAAFRVVAFLCWVMICVPIYVCVLFFKLPFQSHLPPYFHKVLTRLILGMKIEVQGTMSHVVPTLFLCNHLSYLDTISIASVIPTHFVAKAEVAYWPLFGFLTKLQGTVFIDRRNKKGTAEQGAAMIKVMRDKKNIVLFPEGTSTNGSEVKFFKSGLIQSILDMNDIDVMVQPVSISCYGKNGIEQRYAWYGDMTLMPHLWKVFETSGLHIRITFHAPFKASRFNDRKELSEFARKQVEIGPYGIFSDAQMKALSPAQPVG
jgi:lyso-ornithine lipid O-acyltransferase